MGAPTYEFSEIENATLASTARFAKIWGVISVVLGVLFLLLGSAVVVFIGATVATAPPSSGVSPASVVAVGVALIPSSLVSIIVGVFYFMSGNSLQQVVTTQGDDIALLMKALETFKRAFAIEAIAVGVSFVIGFVLSFAMNMANGGR